MFNAYVEGEQPMSNGCDERCNIPKTVVEFLFFKHPKYNQFVTNNHHTKYSQHRSEIKSRCKIKSRGMLCVHIGPFSLKMDIPKNVKQQNRNHKAQRISSKYHMSYIHCHELPLLSYILMTQATPMVFLPSVMGYPLGPLFSWVGPSSFLVVPSLL